MDGGAADAAIFVRGDFKKLNVPLYRYARRLIITGARSGAGERARVSSIALPGYKSAKFWNYQAAGHERLFPSRGIAGNILPSGIGVERGTHRRLIFLCSGAAAPRFTRQICDHKMSGTKSNMLHRKTSEIIIGTFIGSTGTK